MYGEQTPYLLTVTSEMRCSVGGIQLGAGGKETEGFACEREDFEDFAALWKPKTGLYCRNPGGR